MHFRFPFGNEKIEFHLELSESQIKQLLIKEINPDIPKIIGTTESILKHSLNKPINSKPLESHLKNHKGNIIIVVDDYTRKFPMQEILPRFLTYLKEYGISNHQIKILVACGTHKPPSKHHLEKQFGDLSKEYQIIISSTYTSKFIHLGTTSRGTPVNINEDYVNSDFKVLLTDVTLHYFAGYGGDRKSIVPGLANSQTINLNHKMTTWDDVAPGKLIGNPIHEDLLEAAKMIGADFVVNVSLDSEGNIFDIQSGALNDAFLVAIENFKKYMVLDLPKQQKQADLLIISPGGYPYDINYYQSMKALHLCRNAVKPNGTIIFLSECSEGVGNEIFKEWITEYKTLAEIRYQIEHNFDQGGNSAFFQHDFISRNKIFMKSKLNPDFVQNKLMMTPIDDLQNSLNKIIKEVNPKSIFLIKAGSKIMTVATKL